MSTIFFIKIAIFVAALIGSRVILHRVGKNLTDVQKEQIANASATVFLIRNVLIFGTVFVSILSFRQSGALRDAVEFLLAFVVPAAIILLAIINFVQINRLGLPKSIRNGYLCSVFVLLTGIIILLVPF